MNPLSPTRNPQSCNDLATPDELLAYIPYSVSATSQSLGWKNIRVEIWRNPPAEGEILCPGGTHHELIVPLCGTNTTVRSFGGLTWSSEGRDLLTEYDFIPAGCDNRWEWRGGGCEYASLDIDPRFLPEAFWRYDTIQMIPQVGRRCDQIRRTATLLVEELETGGHNGTLYVDSLMSSLAALLIENASCEGLNVSSRLPDARIRKAVDYIRANFQAPLTLQELAQTAGLSQWHFCVAFRRATNTSAWQFVVGQRLQRSLTLLGNSTRSITEIALELGFSSQAHFSSVFTRNMGLSPSSFRRGHRKHRTILNATPGSDR